MDKGVILEGDWEVFASHIVIDGSNCKELTDYQWKAIQRILSSEDWINSTGITAIVCKNFNLDEAHMYFTPQIEDLRVGYECEVYTDKWKKIRLNQKEGLQVSVTDIALERYKIRVPYLTKEKINMEGWMDSSGKDYKVSLFRKKNFTLGYNWEEKTLKIVTFEDNSHTLYNGTCRDINEFRQISKLLNII